MKILYQGAEAIIYLDEKNKKIIKERIQKNYRLKEIDEKIRRRRTKKEARIIEKLREIGLNVPKILNLSDFKIEMEYIEGKRLKEILSEENYKYFAEEVAKIVSKMHENNVVHGDLTTSNFIFSNGKLYVIDFGLSENSNKIEKFAEDLLTLYYALKATHFEILEKFWEIFVNEYKKRFEKGEKVLERFKEILKRGRYIER